MYVGVIWNISPVWAARSATKLPRRMQRCFKCLACGISTVSSSRRQLNTDSSQYVVPLWIEMAEATAKSQCLPINKVHLVASSDSFVCLKCFNAFKRYRILKEQLQMNMKEAITQSSVSTDASRMSGDSDQHVGNKRAGEASVSLARQPLLRKKEKGSGGKGCTAVSPWNAIIGILCALFRN